MSQNLHPRPPLSFSTERTIVRRMPLCLIRWLLRKRERERIDIWKCISGFSKMHRWTRRAPRKSRADPSARFVVSSNLTNSFRAERRLKKKNKTKKNTRVTQSDYIQIGCKSKANWRTTNRRKTSDSACSTVVAACSEKVTACIRR